MRARSILLLLLVAALSGPLPALAGPALLLDSSDGKVLYAEDMDDQWHPASLTKIMTAYIVFEEIKAGRLTLGSKVTCSAHAHAQPPSKIGLPVGGQLDVEMALKALIVKSANDVAVMLAETVSGSEQAFVERMNATAVRLGMTRTRFVNANGLPAAEQVTTARDLARLARATYADFPEFAPYWAMPETRLGKIRLTTHNGLLKSFEGADGMKTGFICDSGFNIVATATRDGRRLIAVVLGELSGPDRTLRATSLLEHGFQNLGWKQIFNTATIDNMPLAADAKAIVSMRQSVVVWDCGGRKPAVAKKKTKSKTKAAATGKPKPKETGTAGAVVPVATKPEKPAAPATTAAKPAKKAKPAAAPAQASPGGTTAQTPSGTTGTVVKQAANPDSRPAPKPDQPQAP